MFLFYLLLNRDVQSLVLLPSQDYRDVQSLVLLPSQDYGDVQSLVSLPSQDYGDVQSLVLLPSQDYEHRDGCSEQITDSRANPQIPQDLIHVH